MAQFVIFINQIQGIDLILKALRNSGCIASSDLADGIENNLSIVDDQGILRPANQPPREEPKAIQPFQVIAGGKAKH